MALHGNDNLVIYGISEGSLIATAEMRKLVEQYPKGSDDAPDIDFVMQATRRCRGATRDQIKKTLNRTKDDDDSDGAHARSADSE